MKNNGEKFSTRGRSVFNGKVFLISVLLATIFILPIFVSAEYKLLESIPGGPEKGTPTEISDYLTAIFKFAIAAAAILAVVMIVIGGLQYIGAAGNTSVIEDAKDRIYWAVVGLFLALGSFLILQTISPEFLKFELGSITKTKDIAGTPDTTKPFACYIQFKTGASTNLPYTNKKECQEECVKEKLEKSKEQKGKGFVDIDNAYCYGKGVTAVTQITDPGAECGLLKTKPNCEKAKAQGCEWYTPAQPNAQGWCRINCGNFKNDTDCESEENKKFCSWKAQISYGKETSYSCTNKDNP